MSERLLALKLIGREPNLTRYVWDIGRNYGFLRLFQCQRDITDGSPVACVEHGTIGRDLAMAAADARLCGSVINQIGHSPFVASGRLQLTSCWPLIVLFMLPYDATVRH